MNFFQDVPEISIEVNQREIDEFEKLILTCIVKSFTPVEIFWEFEGKKLKQISSK